MSPIEKMKNYDAESAIQEDDRITAILEEYNEAEPHVCIIRARAVTEAYAENHGAPVIIKKAKAFSKICERIPINIYNKELIVGSSGTFRRSAGISPDISWQWIKDEIETIGTRKQDPYTIDEGDLRELLDDILPFWNGKSIEEAFLARLPKETAKIVVDTGIVDNDSKWRCAVGEIPRITRIFCL